MGTRVVAVVGSYRRGGAVDCAVEAVLEGARAKGAETRTIRLDEHHLEFCMNCRRCTQLPGMQRGRCPQKDDLESILGTIEGADSIVLASPVNYFNVTALFRRFLERLLGYAYWPWGQNGPKLRNKHYTRKAILVSAAAMPGFLIPFMTGTFRALRLTARLLGAKPVGKLWVGLTARNPQPTLSARTLERARQMGMKLA